MRVFASNVLGFFVGVVVSVVILSFLMVSYSKFACNELLARLYLHDISSVMEKLDRREGLSALVIVDNLSESQERLQHCPGIDFWGMLSSGAMYTFNPDGVMVSNEVRKRELSYLRKRAERLIAVKNSIN